jgi:hypothetical protein
MKRQFRLKTLLVAVAIAAILCALAAEAMHLLRTGRSPFEVLVVMVVSLIGIRTLLSVHGPRWDVLNGRLLVEDANPPDGDEGK